MSALEQVGSAAPLDEPEINIQDAVGCAAGLVEDLTAWLTGVAGEVAPGGDLGIRLTDDAEMRALNARYRGRDETTDVLSFPGESTVEGSHVGDIVISIAVAEEQAAVAGHPLERELRALLLHGLLHCLGHDHETDDGEMAGLERRLGEQWLDVDA